MAAGAGLHPQIERAIGQRAIPTGLRAGNILGFHCSVVRAVAEYVTDTQPLNGTSHAAQTAGPCESIQARNTHAGSEHAPPSANAHEHKRYM
jgi:hypothetical protein